MDMVQMGEFLATLRKEKKWTQAELGEKLGVTNKTVSRWETGNYLPPVEMLEQLSELYGLTINELLCGKKLEQEEFKEVAEENIKAALAASAFEFEGEDRFFQEKVVEREQSSPGAWWNHLARSLDRFEISGRSAGGTGRCRWTIGSHPVYVFLQQYDELC